MHRDATVPEHLCSRACRDAGQRSRGAAQQIGAAGLPAHQIGVGHAEEAVEVMDSLCESTGGETRASQ